MASSGPEHKYFGFWMDTVLVAAPDCWLRGRIDIGFDLERCAEIDCAGWRAEVLCPISSLSHDCAVSQPSRVQAWFFLVQPRAQRESCTCALDNPNEGAIATMQAAYVQSGLIDGLMRHQRHQRHLDRRVFLPR